MLQQNLRSDQLPVKNIQLSVAVKNSSESKRKDREENFCNHRNENGWCSKSQKQCFSLPDFFLKHQILQYGTKNNGADNDTHGAAR